MNENKRRAIIIDTDPGVDDAASLFWVLTNPQFDIKAITIANGNVSLDQCAINALKILEAAGQSHIPVYIGAPDPLLRPTVDAAWVHGNDGLGDAGFPTPKVLATPGYAPAEMARIAAECGDITILALAPLTNVALAVRLDPDFKKHVKEILFMGGAVRVPGNESPAASFNPAVDPDAARIVYRSGIPVVQLGLDVCDKVREMPEDFEKLAAAHTPVTDFILRMLAFIRSKARRVYTDESGRVTGVDAVQDSAGVGLNDLTATAYLIEPGWFKTRALYIDIDTAGLCPGQTVADFRGMWGKQPNALWAYDVDARALVDRWVADICAYRPV